MEKDDGEENLNEQILKKLKRIHISLGWIVIILLFWFVVWLILQLLIVFE
jgi:hypothetical protein